MDRIKRLGMVALATSVFSFTLSGCAQPNQTTSTENLAPADAQILAAVLTGAKSSGVIVNNPCTSANFEVPDFITFSKATSVAFIPPGVDQNGVPNRGAWKQEVHEEGCGVSRVLNVLVSINGPAKLGTRPLWPGSSQADPLLQADGLRYAALSAGWPVKGCPTGYIENTEYLGTSGPPLPGAKASPWQERWTLTACSRRAQVIMNFIPDPKGGTIINTTRPQS